MLNYPVLPHFSLIRSFSVLSDPHCPDTVSYTHLIIYVSPAHMTKWGDIMPVSRRLELVNYSAAHGSLVIEDDVENEFVYLQKPTPSLFGLAGGQLSLIHI